MIDIRLLCIITLSFLVVFSNQLYAKEKTWTNPVDGTVFCWIPAGSFTATLQNDKKNADPVEKEIKFDQGFWMARTEVTIAQFKKFVKETGYITEAENNNHKFTWKTPGFKQDDDHPVVYVSFHDAKQYANWAGVSLPTEKEWVYAAKAGTSTIFYWGDEVDNRFLWHRGNAIDGTKPVATKLANAWGLYDMVGSVKEFCTVCESNVVARGSSWTRCPEYISRQGTLSKPLLSAMKPKLAPCSTDPDTMFDDDRGFRCLIRKIP